MTAALLASLLALQDSALERRVLGLVEKLSGDAIDGREEAAAALVELGLPAVPVLERLAGTGDAERRGRLAGILREIARDAVLRQTWRPAGRIDASWADVPLARALGELAEGTGEALKGFEGLPGKVTLDLRRATVWEALDALCRGTSGLTWSIEGDAIALSAGRRPPYPAVVRDELTAWVDVVEYGRDVDFSGVAREWAVIGLNFAWTGGLKPAGIEFRATELLDGAGRNLLPGGGFRIAQAQRSAATGGRHRREETRVGLLPGTLLKRVRGYGQLLFPRGYEELSVPFGGGGVLSAGDARVALRGGSSTKGRCAFQAVITYTGGASGARLPPAEVFVVDDEGGEHAATGRGQATSFSGTAWSIHQSYEAAMPPDRRPVSVRMRVLRDVFVRRIDFDFDGLPAP